MIECSICREPKPHNANYFMPAKKIAHGLLDVCRICYLSKSVKARAYTRNVKPRAFKVVSSSKSIRRPSISYKVRGIILGYFNKRCVVCGRTASASHGIALDHWIPYTLSHDNALTNLVPLCHSLKTREVAGCNNSKGKKLPLEWLTQTYGEEKAKEIMSKVEAYFAWVKATYIDKKGITL